MAVRVHAHKHRACSAWTALTARCAHALARIADACRKNRACALAGSPPGRPGAGAAVCVSAYVNSLNPAQLKQFTYDLRLTEPSVVGTCDGACWMRQVRRRQRLWRMPDEAVA